MTIDLSAFHFLRPLWLLLIPAGVILAMLWYRRHDVARALAGVIAPHLLNHLLITPPQAGRIRPIHVFVAMLMLGAVAAAGPTWQQDRPDFLENRAPLLLAVDLSPSMDADDIAPSRLGAVKHKLHDLIRRRAGARTGLIAYAGKAHLVMPPTEDPKLLDTFLQALGTDLIPEVGKDVLGVIEEAERLLGLDTPGTLLLLTDGADARQFAPIEARLQKSELQVLVLATGAQDRGMLRSPDGQPRMDDNGRPILGRFDAEGLKQLARAADAPLGSLSLNDDDLEWVELHAQRHFQASSANAQRVRWKDAGYWLCWPLLLVGLLAIRKGWRIHWLAGLVLTLGVGGLTPSARAAGFADVFFTADQQGRWAFEHQRYPSAAHTFADPYWKGLAAYRAADYDAAMASFAQLDTPAAYFYLGNCYVKLSKFSQAISAYEHALELQPVFDEAQANLALARALFKERQGQQKAGNPDENPDEVKFDDQPPAGKQVEQRVKMAASDQQWLDNLTTSPAQFLRQKFRLQHPAPQVTQ